jgi:hypothetical protein
MKVKDILKLFEGVDPETEVVCNTMIVSVSDIRTSVCDNAKLRFDNEGGQVTLYIDGVETDRY